MRLYLILRENARFLYFLFSLLFLQYGPELKASEHVTSSKECIEGEQSLTMQEVEKLQVRHFDVIFSNRLLGGLF